MRGRCPERLAERERDWLRFEHNGVRRSGRRADEAEVLLVERLRCVEVARLQEMKSGPVAGMTLLLRFVSDF